MDHSTHNRIVSFIWSIADDCLLEDTKEAVLAEVRFQKDEADMPVLDPDGLREQILSFSQS